MAKPRYFPDSRLKWTDGLDSCPIWPSLPDTSVIAAIAASPLGLPAQSLSVRFLGDGANHKVYDINPEDPSSTLPTYIFRVAVPVDPVYKMESEMATLEFLRQKTTIPVPRPVAWCSTATNSLGYEWALLEKIPGVELRDVWQDVPWKKKVEIIENLATYCAQIWDPDLGFAQIGSLYFSTFINREPSADNNVDDHASNESATSDGSTVASIDAIPVRPAVNDRNAITSVNAASTNNAATINTADLIDTAALIDAAASTNHVASITNAASVNDVASVNEIASANDIASANNAASTQDTAYTNDVASTNDAASTRDAPAFDYATKASDALAPVESATYESRVAASVQSTVGNDDAAISTHIENRTADYLIDCNASVEPTDIEDIAAYSDQPLFWADVAKPTTEDNNDTTSIESTPDDDETASDFMAALISAYIIESVVDALDENAASTESANDKDAVASTGRSAPRTDAYTAALTELPDVSMSSVDSATERGFRIGPVVDGAFFSGRRRYLESCRGPFDSCSSWLTALVSIEQEFIKTARLLIEEHRAATGKHSVEGADDFIDEIGIYDNDEEFDFMMKSCDQYLQAIPLIFPLTQEDVEPHFVLHHCDLRSANIIVHPVTFELAGIIDWESTCTVPEWYGIDYPMLINTREPITERPTDSTIDPDGIDGDLWEIKDLRSVFDDKLEQLGYNRNWRTKSRKDEFKSNFLEGVSDLSEACKRAAYKLRKIHDGIGRVAT